MSRVYSDKALRSFFGAREGGQSRPQAINTPLFLIRVISRLWPKGIALDPCSNVWSQVPARVRVLAKEVDDNTYCICSPPVYPLTKDGGLSIDWPDYTYANVPYRDLKPWLTKPVPTMEHLILCPVRPNRIWWCEAISTASVECYLRPFAFDGHKQCYPTPLVMAYWGCRIDKFVTAFAEYGMIGHFSAKKYIIDNKPIEIDRQLPLQL